MTFLKLFTTLKYCAAHVQSKTDRRLIGNQRKTCLPIALILKCCYRGNFYRLMELQWPLVAKNSVKTDGGEIPSSQLLSLLKRAQKGIMCSNSLQICAESLQLLNIPSAFKLANCNLDKLVETLFLSKCPIPLVQPRCAWKLSETQGMTQLLAPSCRKAAVPLR